MYKLNINHWNLQHQWVILRIDGNVPTENNRILDDFRLISILSTLNYILERGGRCIILSHRGRPQGFDNSLSTRILAEWFVNKGYSTVFASTLDDLKEHQQTDVSCIMFENIRFFDLLAADQAHIFYQSLASCASFYIFDGWAVAHRNDPSLVLLPTFFKNEERSIGFLIAHELHHLNFFKKSESLMLILGGGKGDEKLRIAAYIKNLKELFVLPAVSLEYSAFERVFSVKTHVYETFLMIQNYC
jgi:phosphoglycerate kinase